MPKPDSPSEVIAKAQKKAKRESLELALLAQIRAANLPEPKRQYQIVPGRKLSWDFAWPELMVGAEVNGQTYKLGGHSSGAGLNRDYEKANAANLLSWAVFSFSKDHIKSGYALETLQAAMKTFQPF